MDSKTLSALLLILSPIIMIVFFLGLGPDGGDVIGTKYAYGIGTFGWLLAIVGLSMIKDEMAGGAGATYAGVGVLLLILSASAGITEAALDIVAVEAANPLMAAAAESVGNISTAVSMLAVAVIGAAFLVQKNFPTILSGLMTIVGIVGVAMAVTSYSDDDLMMIPYVGWMVVILALGIVRLRAKA
jgi:hypothetical protein